MWWILSQLSPLEKTRREQNIAFGSSFYLEKVSGKLKRIVYKVKNKNKRQQRFTVALENYIRKAHLTLAKKCLTEECKHVWIIDNFDIFLF